MSSGSGYWGPSDWNERPGFRGRGRGRGGGPPCGDGLLPTPPLYNPAPYSGGLLPDPSPYGMPRDPWERQQYRHDLPWMGHRGPSGLLPRPPLKLNWRVVEDYSESPNQNKKRSQYKMDDYHPPFKQPRQSLDNHGYLGYAGYGPSKYKYGPSRSTSRWGKKPELEMTTGLKGYILTCNSHERNCVREAYGILQNFGDKLFGPRPRTDEIKENTDATNEGNGKEEREEEEDREEEEERSQDEETEDDKIVANSKLQDDHDETETTPTGSDKEKNGKDQESSPKVQDKERRFSQVITGNNRCMFIKTTLEDPLALSLAIMDHILETKKQRTTHLVRMVPVQTTCKASLEEIEKASRKLAQEYFKEGGKTFGFFFKTRTNKSFNLKPVKPVLLKVLEEAHPDNSLSRDTAEVVLNVEIILGYCCLSLLPHYFGKYAKYNLVNIAKRAMEEKKVKEGEVAGADTDHDHNKDISAAEDEYEGNQYEGDEGNQYEGDEGNQYEGDEGNQYEGNVEEEWNQNEEENQEEAMDNWTNLGEEMEED